MECFNCGVEVDKNDTVCPHCGADLGVYRRILASANALYNEGLEKAKSRNIYGAIESLNRALKYNKRHIDARNLLGLCYYETGDSVRALNEWVISKNFQPSHNRCDKYLKEVQGPGELEKINNTNRKFNQALRYAQEGNRDLARMQLRRVTGMSPRFIRAYQLLAICYMAEENYTEARKVLLKAHRIDSGDPRTIRYLKEVREELKERSKGKKKKKSNAVAFTDGNDIILTPRESFSDVLYNSRTTVLNILIGAVAGILISVFLIFPAVQSHENSKTADALVNANQTQQSSGTTIKSLQKQVKDLQNQLAEYTGDNNATTAYDTLMQAQSQAASDDLEGAAQTLSSVNRDVLSTNGQAAYDALQQQVSSYQLDSSNEAGHKAYLQKNYTDAITQYTTTVGLDPTYSDGRALYELADSYVQTGDRDNAVKYLEQVVTSKSSYAKKATDALTDLGVTVNDDGTFTDSQATTDTSGAANSDDPAEIAKENAELQTN